MPRASHHTAPVRSMPAALDTADLWANEVVPNVPADLEAQARALGAWRRRRAFASATDLLRGVLAFVLITTSLQHLGAWAVCAGVADISAAAWHKCLIRCRPWLAWLLMELLTPPTPPPASSWPAVRGTILLVDATCLGRVGGSGDDWRWHMAYDLTRGRLAQVTLTERAGGEHLGHYALQPGDLVVADSGYGYRRSVALVNAQQADVIIRIRPTTFPLETASGHVVDVVAALQRRGPPVRTWDGWCTTADGERFQVRLIAGQLTPQAAAAARRRARQTAKKRGRCVRAATLVVAGWVLLITTLPERAWDAAAVLRLYRARWQIELVFKRMKSIMRMGTLRARTPASLEVTLLALLVAWMLQETEARRVRSVLQQLTGAPERTVSSWWLTTLSVDVLRQQVRGAWGQARVQACLPRLQRFLSSHTRRDRGHQETDVRAWLARRPMPTIQVDEGHAWEPDWDLAA